MNQMSTPRLQPVEGVQRVPPQQAGQRVDQVAAQLFSAFSRSQLQQWIKQGDLRVDGVPAKASQRLVGGELLQLQAALEKHDEHRAEAIPLNLLYEDESLLVVNKPAGMVVHPAAGNWSGTLVNALLHYDAALEVLPRAGIVHRLDKDTSGALLVARSSAVRQQLVTAMQARHITRQYVALVWGRPPPRVTVDEPIGRHPRERTRMAVVAGGKPARTHLFRDQVWRHACGIRAQLDSGRTHQIRVHCSHQGWPLVGDPVYGRRRLPAALAPPLVAVLTGFQRQALHAYELSFEHPVQRRPIFCQAPLPADLQALCQAFADYDAEATRTR